MGNYLFKNGRRLFFTLAILFFGLSAVSAVCANQDCIEILYPKVKEPYRSVIQEIISGVKNVSSLPLIEVIVTNKEPINRYGDSQCKVAIGLGKLGMAALAKMEIPAIAGAVLAKPGEPVDVPTISLLPHPRQLFSRLKTFTPNIDTVTVVYNKDNSGHLIELARTTAEEFDFKLKPVEVADIQQAVRNYRKILSEMDPNRDALWLIRDRATIDTKTILPLVLEKSWSRNLTVYSSIVSHVKYGALFSVYPDNYGLGQQLGNMAVQCASDNCAKNHVILLQQVRTAINKRTATHINSKINLRKNPLVDMVFPK